MHTPGAVVIDGDWREVQPVWSSLLADVGNVALALFGLIFATAFSLLFLGSVAVILVVIVMLLAH